MYDPKCLDLAIAFLEEWSSLDTAEHRDALAQAIQDRIELEMDFWDGEREEVEANATKT